MTTTISSGQNLTVSSGQAFNAVDDYGFVNILGGSIANLVVSSGGGVAVSS